MARQKLFRRKVTLTTFDGQAKRYVAMVTLTEKPLARLIARAIYGSGRTAVGDNAFEIEVVPLQSSTGL